MSIGTRWKQAREAAGLSAAKAALAAGVHENTIYLLENERKNDGVTVRICKQVADAYGVTLSEIFCADGEQPVRVPAELRPLTDLLQPLTMDARVSFVRNVVSNARFMAHLIAISGDGRHAPAVSPMLYNSGSKSERADELKMVEALMPSAGSSAGETGERATQTARRETRRKVR